MSLRWLLCPSRPVLTLLKAWDHGPCLLTFNAVPHSAHTANGSRFGESGQLRRCSKQLECQIVQLAKRLCTRGSRPADHSESARAAT
jgi:hypothetical protein